MSAGESRFPAQLRFQAQADVARVLGSVGDDVRARTGKDRRTADDRDWWCFRRWLFTLAADQQLMFPLTVHRGPTEGGPDFLLAYDALPVGLHGLEVTEATNPEDSRERTLCEIAPDSMHLLGDFGGRSYERGSRQSLIDDYTGQIIDGLDRKLAKAPNYFSKCHSLDLLIYVNNNVGPYVTLESVASVLTTTFAAKIEDSGEARRFGRVAVIDHVETLLYFDGDFRMYRTRDA